MALSYADPIVKHTFKRTTTIGHATYFAGVAYLPESQLKLHRKQIELRRRIEAQQAANMGKTAEEILAEGAWHQVGMEQAAEAAAEAGEVRDEDAPAPPPNAILPPPTNAEGLRTDGPTLEGWMAAGYPKNTYPPKGWAALPSPANPKAQSFIKTPENKPNPNDKIPPVKDE